MHAGIGMAGMGRRQEVRRLEEELFINSHWRCLRDFSRADQRLYATAKTRREFSRQSQNFVGLQAEAPSGVFEAIFDRGLQIRRPARAVVEGL